MPTLESVRSFYPDDDPVHGFDHIERVYRMAERLAAAEGADIEIVRAAALLHDAEGSATAGGEEGRLEHQLASAELAGKVLVSDGWSEERIEAVRHCIRAHRFRDNREQPQTVEAKVIFDADKLDVIGAIGVARTVAFDAVIGQPVFSMPSEQFIKTGVPEQDETYSSYHEYLFKLSKIKDRLFTPSARLIAEDRHRFMDNFFRRLRAETAGEM
jgi:uncharacterized protein